ncbi:MAG: tetratricopeptide repeat protein [Bacteroidales bacterium]|nr:tetratricopeptide repeat protein [Bacteroidales bacterium]
MKKLTLIFTAICALFLTSCENPAKSRIYTEEGSKLLLRYSEYKKAEETLTQAIKYDKSNFEAYYYRGCARVNAMSYDEAIADFEKAIELKPDYADAYFNLGRVYYIMHDEDKACENYKLAEKYGRPNLEDYLKRCN